MENDMTLDEFEIMVSKHDLTYAYSDDPHWYRRGKQEREEILEAAKQFPREDVVRIWNEMVDRKLLDGTGFYWKV